MKREDENIDQLFKDAFAGGTFEFKEAYWQNAKEMLQKEKPKAWYYKPTAIASIILLFGLGISALLYSKLENTDRVDSNFISPSSPTTSSSISNLEQKTNNSSVSDNNGSSSTESEEVTLLDSGFFDQEPTLSFANSENESDVRSNNNSNSKAEKTSLAMSSNAKKASFRKMSTTKNNDAITTVLNQSQSTSFKSSSSGVPTLSNENMLFATKTESNTLLSNREQLSPLYLPTISLLDLEKNPTLENISQNTKTTSKKQLSLPLSLRLSAGNLWGKGTNDKTQIDAQNLNMEVSAEYHFDGHWGLQLGLSYNQVTEKQFLETSETYASNYWEVQDNSFWNFQDISVVTDDGIWWLGSWWQPPTYDTIVDSTFVSQIDSNYIQKTDTSTASLDATQQLKIIEIPLMVTYNIWINRWSVQLATGASLGIYTGSNGTVIANGDPTSIQSTESTMFNSIQYNYLLSTEVGYSIANHWQITARPQMKMNLNSIYQKDSGFSQKLTYFGINAGLVYRF